MRYKILFFLLIQAFYIQCQINSTVYEEGCKTPIAFVNIWVKDVNFGTTTDDKGQFKLDYERDSSFLVFSAVGYETKTLPISHIDNCIELKKNIYSIESIVVIPLTGAKKRKIGKIKKGKVEKYFSCGKFPWRIAKPIDYELVFKETPFLNELKILTESDLPNTVLRMDIVEQTKDIENPQNVLESSIYKSIELGKNITSIDLKPYQIKIPKNGIIIIFEWLIIDQNRHKFENFNVFTNQNESRVSYEPSIGVIPIQTSKTTFMYSKGKWKKNTGNLGFLEDEGSKHYEIATELILSN